ncbi:MAG: DUF1972 domain-containing protein [Bacteroidota bacterium]
MSNKTRVAIIGVVGVPARYGGLETLAHHFVLNLANRYDLTVYNTKTMYEAHERPDTWEGAKVKYIPFKANGAQSVIYDIIAMLWAVWSHDVLVVLGVSGGLVMPIIKWFFPSKKLIVNIDGLEWRRPKWGKFAKSYLKFAEKLANRYADRIVADNKGIQDYVTEIYGRESDMIAYGGDHARSAEIQAEDREAYPFLSGRYAVKACRIEPENNIEMILEGFSRFEDISLVILGNWNDSAFGRSMRQKYSKYAHIHMLDFIRDMRVLDMLRANSYVYLHGHSAGGTNPSLVEAMNLGLPIISFDVIFNRETTESKAIFFDSADKLLAELRQLTPESRAATGENMREVAQRRYTWKVISEQYATSIEKSLQPKSSLSDNLETQSAI